MSIKKKKDPWKEIKRLEEENKKLIDENASLWFLLDEFEKSSILNEEHKEKINEALGKLKEVGLMMHPKTGEA
jgi:hypothetical protein|tara:strand:+ start:629 stop:847 length:219 start_codon:yes stop_codon:yes gene_type:complete